MMLKHLILAAVLLTAAACVDDRTQIDAIDSVGGLPGRALRPDAAFFASPAYFRELRALADIPDNAERDVSVGTHAVRISLTSPRINGLGSVCRNYRAVMTDVRPQLQALPAPEHPVDTGRVCRIEGEAWSVRRTLENG